jgi:Lrp/AsnC family transcriptional regulator, leucine-responsive regulatory protein
MRSADLSPLDRRIIQILQREGRMTFAQIGSLAGVSSTAAHERIKKLEARGVITGYRASVDPSKVGAEVTAFIFVSQMAGPRGVLEDVFDRMPAVEECHRIAGDETLLLKVRAPSMEALDDVVWEIRALEEVERTRTVVVLSTVFEDRPVSPYAEEAETGG